MNKQEVIGTFNTFCQLNLCEPTQDTYDRFAVTRCTSCGSMRVALNASCGQCGAKQGVGFTYDELFQ